jgi:peptidoglycan/LPS O-acetylase OafA/YrhL
VRLIVLDSWRGLAALFIAALHFNVATPGYDSAIWRFAPLALDFFFVLSGYMITRAYFSTVTTPRIAVGFLVRRLGRLFPLHAFVLVCFILVELAKVEVVGAGFPASTAPFAENGPTSLSSLIPNCLLLHGTGLSDRLTWNSPSWAISAMFWVYVIFAALSVLRPFSISLIMIALCLGAAIGLAFGIGDHDLDLTYDYGLLRCLMSFSIGHLAAFAKNLGIKVADRGHGHGARMSDPHRDRRRLDHDDRDVRHSHHARPVRHHDCRIQS